MTSFRVSIAQNASRITVYHGPELPRPYLRRFCADVIFAALDHIMPYSFYSIGSLHTSVLRFHFIPRIPR